MVVNKEKKQIMSKSSNNNKRIAKRTLLLDFSKRTNLNGIELRLVLL